MFNCMRHGKAGRTLRDLPAGTAMRDLFRQTEDMLTGTVFERIGYLPGPEAWSLLRGTFPDLPDRRLIEIVDIEFWPTLETEDEGRRFVEPDVVLTVDLGDPARRTVLVVEAKTAGGQYSDQWGAQLRAVKLRTEDDGATEDIIYAALGGLGGPDPKSLWMAVPADLREGIHFVHGDWSDLGRAIASRSSKSPEIDRIVEDIAEALALYGYVTTRLSEAMFEIDRPRNAEEALKAMTMGEAA